MENKNYPGSYYQPLFDLLHQEHGITPLESEMTEIIFVVEKMRGKQPGPRWVKCSDRLPGYKLRVRWRDGNDHSFATKGKISLFEMDKPNLEGWEWLDEQPAAVREEDAVAFAEWLNSNFVSIENKEGEAVYVEYGPQEYDKKQQFRIGKLYELFKQHNP